MIRIFALSLLFITLTGCAGFTHYSYDQSLLEKSQPDLTGLKIQVQHYIREREPEFNVAPSQAYTYMYLQNAQNLLSAFQIEPPEQVIDGYISNPDRPDAVIYQNGPTKEQVMISKWYIASLYTAYLNHRLLQMGAMVVPHGADFTVDLEYRYTSTFLGKYFSASQCTEEASSMGLMFAQMPLQIISLGLIPMYFTMPCNLDMRVKDASGNLVAQEISEVELSRYSSFWSLMYRDSFEDQRKAEKVEALLTINQINTMLQTFSEQYVFE